MTLITLDRLPNTRAGAETLRHPYESGYDSDLDENEEAGPGIEDRRRWWHFLPLCLVLAFLFGPQWFILQMLLSYYLRAFNSPTMFALHLGVIHAFTFLACSSLMVCIVRDPGLVRFEGDDHPQLHEDDGVVIDDAEEAPGDDDTVLDSEADQERIELVEREGESGSGLPHGWCRKCRSPKPERTHHCSICGRCVLKMDHHCPWMAHKCIGHWTYPAFLHFLFCTTALSIYVFGVSLRIVWHAFVDMTVVDERTALHALFLTMLSAIFALSIGSFLAWHVYLVTTNQTTLESLTPFLLLRYLPGVRATSETGNRKAPMPFENALSAAQRRHVRYAHAHIRIYDVGFRKNWHDVFGWRSRRDWVARLLYGGGGLGDGRTFPRNPRARELLARLVVALEEEEVTRR